MQRIVAEANALEKEQSRDLEKIKLRLPKNDSFAANSDSANLMTGLCTNFSGAVTDCLLSFQTNSGVLGNILEFGRLSWPLSYVDGLQAQCSETSGSRGCRSFLDPRFMAAFRESIDFFKTTSHNFRKAYPEYREKRGAFRFIHITPVMPTAREAPAELQAAIILFRIAGITRP